MAIRQIRACSRDNGKGLACQAPLIRKKALGQPFRIRQRDEMATGNFLHLLSEPFAHDAALKFDREKTVVSSRKNMNGDFGPALEATGLAENDLGFLRSHIEFRRIAAPRRSLFPRFGRSCCAPPCTSGLAGLGDHRVDEHEHPHGRTRANKGRREAR